MTAHLFHNLGHHLGSLSAHTGINLVEDDCWQLHGTADHRLERQHHTGNLTTRSHLRDRLEWGRCVGAEQERNPVATIYAQLDSGKLDAEPYVWHTQWYQALLHLVLNLLGSLGAQFGKCLGLLTGLGFQLADACVYLVERFVAVLDGLQLLVQHFAFLNQRLDSVNVVFLL